DRAAQTNIELNPYYPSARLDIPGDPICGVATPLHVFRGAFIHEARHAYQNTLLALPGNDVDPAPVEGQHIGDWLVANDVPVPPTKIFVDSAEARTICNPPNGIIPGVAF